MNLLRCGLPLLVLASLACGTSRGRDDTTDTTPDAGLAPDAGSPADAGTPTFGETPLGGRCTARADCVPGATCSGTCEASKPGNFCEACGPVPGAAPCADVDGHPSFCLIDTQAAPGHFFCGAGCASDDDCPSGATCNDVNVLTQETCSPSQGCQPSTHACTSPADCGGAACTNGFCVPPCVTNAPGDVQGFCGCFADSDCPGQECDSTRLRCPLTGEACGPGTANPCPAIACVRENGIGYCRIGRNCAPVAPLGCGDF